MKLNIGKLLDNRSCPWPGLWFEYMLRWGKSFSKESSVFWFSENAKVFYLAHVDHCSNDTLLLTCASSLSPSPHIKVLLMMCCACAWNFGSLYPLKFMPIAQPANVATSIIQRKFPRGYLQVQWLEQWKFLAIQNQWRKKPVFQDSSVFITSIRKFVQWGGPLG